MTGRRSFALGAVVAFVLVLVAIVASRQGSTGGALDPDDTGPLGARGLVLLLEELGAEVRVADDLEQGATTAVLLADIYGPQDRQRLRRWVQAGGTLLVGDPASPLLPRATGSGRVPRFDEDGALLDLAFGVDFERGECAEPAFAGVDSVAGTDGRFVTELAGASSCFADRVVVVPVRAGHIVGLTGPWPLLNGFLGRADNAALAAVVLAPNSGARVTFLEPPLPTGFGGGDGTSLADLVSDPFWLLLIQLGVAAGLVVLWQARRLGRPVEEPQLVLIEGAELTRARGAFLERSSSPDAAAEQLRRQARRTLARRLALPGDAAPALLAGPVAARAAAFGHPTSPEALMALLEARPVATNRELSALAADLDQLVAIVAAGSSDPTPALVPTASPGDPS